MADRSRPSTAAASETIESRSEDGNARQAGHLTRIIW